MESLESKER